MWGATPIYSVDSGDGSGDQVIVFGLLQDVVAPDPTDVFYPVPPAAEFRTDLISQRFYGVPDLWHAIASVNNQLDPLLGFSIQEQIRVPTKARLAQLGLLTL